MSNKNHQKRIISKKNNFQNLSYSKKDELVKIEILGVGITNDSKENILEYILNFLKNTKENCYIITPNPEMVVLAHHAKELKKVLNDAKIALNDGVGLSVAGSLMHKPLKERITGVDFMKNICEKSNDWPITVGFLGGEPKVAEKTAECLKKEFPKLQIAFTGSDWSEKENKQAIDILFVAFGAPKQELWMKEHLDKIPVRIMIGVGGAFDYISGRVPRAPVWMQKIGFEWLFRLVVQPWRWRRQLRLIEFVWLVIKECFTK